MYDLFLVVHYEVFVLLFEQCVEVVLSRWVVSAYIRMLLLKAFWAYLRLTADVLLMNIYLPKINEID